MLRKMAAEGVSYPQIAEALGRSTLAVQMKAWDLGLTRRSSGSRPWSTAEIRRLRDLLAAGGNQSEFARRNRRTISAVYSMARNIRTGEK